jgi:hypothetical protein
MLFQMSIEGHPQDVGISPQGDLALLAIHSPHLVAQNLGSNLQQQFQSTNSLPHNLHNPRNVPPSLQEIPWVVPFIYQGFQCTWLVKNLSGGDSMNSQLL